MDDDVEMIKKMILQQIKPINFGDELNLDDILGEGIAGDTPSDNPNVSIPSEEIPTPLKPVENVVCHVCFKIFTNSRNFKKHFTKHTGKFSCPSCKKVKNITYKRTIVGIRVHFFLQILVFSRYFLERKPN